MRPRETAAVLRHRSVYTIRPCISSKCHLIGNHKGSVHACLAVTCYLHIGQNDRDLLHAVAAINKKE